MSQTLRFTTLILTTLVFLLPTTARAEDKWQLRFGANWVVPDASLIDLDADADGLLIDSNSALGVHLSLERRVSRRLGVEFGIQTAEPDIEFSASILKSHDFFAEAGLRFTSFSTALNFHLTPDRAVDLYLGPLLAYTSYDDIHVTNQSRGQTISAGISSDDDYAFGLQLGFDVQFGDSPWSFGTSLRYIDTSLSLVSDDNTFSELRFDPYILNVGLGFRF